MTMTRTPSPRPPARVPVDERVRERWVTVRREEGRRRLRVLVAVIVVVVVAASALALSRSVLLAVKTIEVSGASRVSGDAIRVASGVEDGDPLLWADAAAAARRVRAVPWVASARVTKHWPHTLRIQVTERAAVAWALGADGAPRLVDPTGRVLERVDAAPEGMPELQGAVRVPGPGRSITPDGAARVAADLGPLAGRAAVVAFVDGRVTVTLLGGVQVRMGEPVDTAAKAAAADAVLAELARDRVSVTYVDVTVASNPVAA